MINFIVITDHIPGVENRGKPERDSHLSCFCIYRVNLRAKKRLGGTTFGNENSNRVMELNLVAHKREFGYWKAELKTISLGY